MGYSASVLTVLIASPEDSAPARAVVAQVIQEWNGDRSRSAHALLLTRHWTQDSVPELGRDARSAINDQMVDEADVLIALFHSRLGAKGSSGTAAEIERAVERGIPVHVFFGTMRHRYDVDALELERLQQYRSDLERRGLVGQYRTYRQLAAVVRTAIEHDIACLLAAPSSVSAAPSGSDDSRSTLIPNGLAHRSSWHRSGPRQRLGSNLMALRKARGLSQEDFAHQLGVHRVYLGGIEHGGRNVSLAAVERLAAGAGVAPLELLS